MKNFDIIRTKEGYNLIRFSNLNYIDESGLMAKQSIPEIDDMKTLVFLTKRAWGFNHFLHRWLEDNFCNKTLSRVSLVSPTSIDNLNFYNHAARSSNISNKPQFRKFSYCNYADINYYNGSNLDSLRGVQSQVSIIKYYSKFINDHLTDVAFGVYELLTFNTRLNSKFNNLIIIQSNDITKSLSTILKTRGTYLIIGNTLENIYLSADYFNSNPISLSEIQS